MSAHHDRFKLGIEAIAFGYVSAFAYGIAYVCLSEGGADGFRLMWMAYALAFLAPLLVPLAILSQMTMVRYAKSGDDRFSYWRAALLGALNGELLTLPGTAVYVLRGDAEFTFEKTESFLLFGITSGLIPFCAVSFMVWAFIKNLRLKAARKAAAIAEEERQKNLELKLRNRPTANRPTVG
jgi:hypothetical protein